MVRVRDRRGLINREPLVITIFILSVPLFYFGSLKEKERKGEERSDHYFFTTFIHSKQESTVRIEFNFHSLTSLDSFYNKDFTKGDHQFFLLDIRPL